MQKFGLSDSLLDAAKAVLQGKQPEPVVEETPDEGEEGEEGEEGAEGEAAAEGEAKAEGGDDKAEKKEGE